MAEIVNLRMARKARARAAASTRAEEARARHGQTRGQRAARDAEITRLARTVDGARREKDPD